MKWNNAGGKRLIQRGCLYRKIIDSYRHDQLAQLGDRHGEKMWERYHRSNIGAFFFLLVRCKCNYCSLAYHKYKQHGHPHALFDAVWLSRNSKSFAPLPFSAMAVCSPTKGLLEKSFVVSLLIIDTDGHMGLGKRNCRICNSPKSSFQSYECFMSFFS